MAPKTTLMEVEVQEQASATAQDLFQVPVAPEPDQEVSAQPEPS